MALLDLRKKKAQAGGMARQVYIPVCAKPLVEEHCQTRDRMLQRDLRDGDSDSAA